MADHLEPGRPLLQRGELVQGLPELGLGADDPDQAVHALLEVLVDAVGVLALSAVERLKGLPDERLGLAAVDRGGGGKRPGVLGRVQAGPTAEDNQVG